MIAGLITYLANFCEGKCEVSIHNEELQNASNFKMRSSGAKGSKTSELDLVSIGFIYRTYIELHRGSIINAEETDKGALI